MRRLAILLLLFALQPDPQPRAAMTTPTSAVITWTQESRGCLYRDTAFIGCYEAPGTYRVALGAVGPLDWTARPRAGDVFVLETGGQVWETKVAWWVWMAVVRR